MKQLLAVQGPPRTGFWQMHAQDSFGGEGRQTWTEDCCHHDAMDKSHTARLGGRTSKRSR